MITFDTGALVAIERRDPRVHDGSAERRRTHHGTRHFHGQDKNGNDPSFAWRPYSVASGRPRSRLPFDAPARNIMGSEIRDLLGRVTQLLDAAGIPFMVAGSFASVAADHAGSRPDI
jgi:hypothetical protein